MSSWYYAEALDKKGQRVELGPYGDRAVALLAAVQLTRYYQSVLVIEYVKSVVSVEGKAQPAVRERRVFNPEGRDVSKRYFHTQRALRSGVR